MVAIYNLGALAIAFLIATAIRASLIGGIRHPQTKTWLLISVIFAVVSLWLFSQG